MTGESNSVNQQLASVGLGVDVNEAGIVPQDLGFSTNPRVF